MKNKRTKLIELRKKKGYSQQNIADLVGISRAYYTNIELNKYTPSLGVAKNISSVLGVKIEDIF